MIEKMITQIKKHLPLKITHAKWNGTIFQIFGSTWNFATLSAWRISNENKVIVGCFDDDSIESIGMLNDLEICDICFQTAFLKIDPLFHFSNGNKLEIFSTDTYEPWTFQINEIGIYIATPSDPSSFNS